MLRCGLQRALQRGVRVGGTAPRARGATSAVTDSDLVAYLRHPTRDQEVFLVGTVHISNRSARLVREVIQSVKPDVVMMILAPDPADRALLDPGRVQNSNLSSP
jgi:hypothetical protein